MTASAGMVKGIRTLQATKGHHSHQNCYSSVYITRCCGVVIEFMVCVCVCLAVYVFVLMPTLVSVRDL